MKALFLTLLLCLSCTKHATVSRDAVGLRVQNVKMEVSQLHEVEWLVGQRRENKISQSFTFIVDMPKIDQEDLDYISEQRGIDAWIVRLIVQRGSERQDLGSLYTLWRPRQLSRVATGAASSVTLKVYYAAAYASERFRMFKCPAFSHNKRIDSMKIAGQNSPFEIAVEGSQPYEERSQLIELTPSSFNGGNSLVGEYFIEIAPYDSKKKIIYSSFKRIPQYIVVEREDVIDVKSCAGIHPELQQ